MRMASKYDVVLSFRGDDTRERFISHLHAALDWKKINTYIDYRLERGDEISPVLLKAIQESKLSLIVFPKNYSSSSWCLDELVQILDCKRRIGQIVIPVFYRVKPSHVRKQKGSIAAGLSKLGERFDEDKMSLWRAALTEAANLSGFDSKKIRPESELVKAIIKDVLKKLNHVSSSDLKGLIGIEEHIEKIESLLCIEDSENFRIVGIWGMGGIGKTTLAEVVFNRFSSQFESCYFLRDVEEKANKYAKPNYFQEKILSVLLEDENLDKGLPSIRSTFVQERLRRKKVLVVLDDIKDNQIELLSRAHDLFGHGSRIIITTRNVQVLRSIISAGEIYEVKGLYWEEAFKLFCQCAFRNKSPTSRDYIEMSKEMVKYTNGNPLALKVLGSFLCCRTKEQWKSALTELKTVPNKEIHNVLKMSYDGLNENQKEIFLDIACFFKDQDKNHVQSILDGCGFSAEIGLQVLVDKSLITIADKKVEMHNLLREMGHEIVRHESIKEPGKRSRLWIAKDIYHVLKNGLGNKAIEGIFLDMSKIRDQLQLRSSSFNKLYNLRLLRIYNSYDLAYPESCKVTLPKGFQSIPDALRYFHWEAYPLKSLPPRFTPYNLVELNMPHSQVEQLWNGIQELGNLKQIDLSWSTQLTQMPNLSLAPNLEGVKLEGCTGLNEVPLYFHDRLTSLNLRSCSNLKNLPEIPQSMERLDLSEIEIQELPSSIWSLHKLHTFHLDGFKHIKDIPSSASMLNSLNSLSLSNCTSLTEFHELPRNISRLNLSNTAIEVIPSSIQCLSGLAYLYLRDCKRLKSLPTSICKLKSLKTILLSGCSQLESFPKILEPMESLEDLYLDETAIKRLHSSIEYLFKLEELSLSSCKNLEFVPTIISHLSKLRYLSFAGCSKLERLPPLDCYWPCLLPLQPYLRDWDALESHWLLSLTTMNLSGTNIEKVPKSIEEVLFLNVLVLSNCKRLKSLPKLPYVLQVLYADDCTSLETVSSSKTELIRDWEDHPMNGMEEEGLTFFNCLNLDQTAKRNIMADAQLRIWRKAALAKEYFNKNASYVFDEPSVFVCCPGSEIPKWFMYQTAGPSVNIKLPLHWFNDNYFLGFAVCIVANFDGDDDNMEKDDNMENSYLKCETRFKTSNGGESHRFDCFLKVWGDTRKVNSDHVFQWYDYDMYDEVRSSWSTTLHNDDITEVEFYFYPHVYYYGEHVCCCTVKHCGIRLLYVQDAENAIFSNQDKQDNEEEEEHDEDESEFHRSLIFSSTEEEEDLEEDDDEEDDEEDQFEFNGSIIGKRRRRTNLFLSSEEEEEEDDEDESEFHRSLIFSSTEEQEEEEDDDEEDEFEFNGSIIGRRRRRINLFVSSEEEEEEEEEDKFEFNGSIIGRRRRRRINLFVSSEEEEEEEREEQPHPKRVKRESNFH